MFGLNDSRSKTAFDGCDTDCVNHVIVTIRVTTINVRTVILQTPGYVKFVFCTVEHIIATNKKSAINNALCQSEFLSTVQKCTNK